MGDPGLPGIRVGALVFLLPNPARDCSRECLAMRTAGAATALGFVREESAFDENGRVVRFPEHSKIRRANTAGRDTRQRADLIEDVARDANRAAALVVHLRAVHPRLW